MKTSNKVTVAALSVALLLLFVGYMVDSNAVTRAIASSGEGYAFVGYGASVWSISQMAASSEAGGLFFQLIISSLLGLIPASIASNKGRSFGTWWFYGTMLFLIALIHSLVISSNKPGTPALVD